MRCGNVAPWERSSGWKRSSPRHARPPEAERARRGERRRLDGEIADAVDELASHPALFPWAKQAARFNHGYKRNMQIHGAGRRFEFDLHPLRRTVTVRFFGYTSNEWRSGTANHSDARPEAVRAVTRELEELLIKDLRDRAQRGR